MQITLTIGHAGGLSDFQKGLLSALAGVLVGAILEPIKLWGYGRFKQWQMRQDLYRELGEVLGILHNILGRLAHGGSPYEWLTNFVEPVPSWIEGATGVSEEEFGYIQMRILELYIETERLRLSRLRELWIFEKVHDHVKSIKEEKEFQAQIAKCRDLLDSLRELLRTKDLNARLYNRYLREGKKKALSWQRSVAIIF